MTSTASLKKSKNLDPRPARSVIVSLSGLDENARVTGLAREIVGLG